MRYSFTVPGTPRPKARPRLGSVGVYTPAPTNRYAHKVATCARQARVRVAPGPFAVTILLWFSERRRRDIDNCAKSILDALTGIAWQDDSDVEQLTLHRGIDRAYPRAEITIETTGENDSAS